MIVSTHSHTTIPMSLTKIAAGAAIEVGEEYKKLDVNKLITKGREGYMAFEVTGDSAVPTIYPGNVVFVDTWAEPRNGSIVAAEVNGLTCVKVFSHSRGGLYLASRNDRYPPRQIKAEDNFRVLGVVKSHLAFD